MTKKTLKCDLCDHEVEADTFENWMTALRPHYGEAHADVMQDTTRSQDQWMTENRKRFEEA